MRRSASRSSSAPRALWRVALLALALALGGCAAIPPPRAFVNLALPDRPVAPADRPAFNGAVLDQVWDWVDRRYYDPRFNGADWAAARDRHRAAVLAARDDTELYAALNRLLGELRDAHAHAWSPREVEEQGKHRGVLLGFRTGHLDDDPERRVILDVFPGSPAALAGVSPGWILLSADGRRPAETLGLGKLREGQVVRCEFLDADRRPRTLDIPARRLRIPPVRDARVLEGAVLYLRFDSFDAAAARWVRQQLRAHPGAAGLVLDLRRNRGGEARAMVSILGDLFAQPVDLGRTVQRGGADEVHRTPRHFFTRPFAGPVAVLVSEHSASAAETVAHTVQHHRRGIVVGAPTPGKVLVSVNWWLPGGGELQLSVYDYLGPGGQRLEGRGVAPDRLVRPALGETRAADEAVVALARAALAAVPPSAGAAR